MGYRCGRDAVGDEITGGMNSSQGAPCHALNTAVCSVECQSDEGVWNLDKTTLGRQTQNKASVPQEGLAKAYNRHSERGSVTLGGRQVC